MTYRWTLAIASLSALLLAGCDDDGDTSPMAQATVTATADTLAVAPGGTSDLLANDTYNGAAATAGTSGNVTLSLAAGATLPAGVTLADDGTLTVAANAAPTAVSFDYQLCDNADSTNCSTAAVSLSVQRNVAGVLVAPAQLTATTSAALTRAAAMAVKRPNVRAAQAVTAAASTTCPDVPTGYDPLASVTVTPLLADGTPGGASFTTDSCGGFTATVGPDVVQLSIAATATLQARTFDVTVFTGSTSVGSTLPTGATYEIASLYLLPSKGIGMSVIDSVTKKAVIGLPASEVSAKVDGTARVVSSLQASLTTAPSSTTLVMDASGSMSTAVYTDTATGVVYDRYALASIAAGEFLTGKLATDEVSIVVFDDTVRPVNDAFLAGLSFVDATSGAARTVTVGADGFTVDTAQLLSVANLYNGDSAIYSRCYANGTLIASCFPYLASSDTSIRLTSSYPFGGSTALWAATDQALGQVDARTSTRKFVVAMTDGQDNASGATTSASVIAKATQFGVPVYMVAFGTQQSVNETEMQQVATATGGSYYRQESQGIIGVFQAIQTGIRFQYSATLAAPALTSGQIVTIGVGANATRDLTIP